MGRPARLRISCPAKRWLTWLSWEFFTLERYQKSQPRRTALTTAIAIDPVCGMQVETAAATVVEHASQPYYFCESACADTFRDDPERWIPKQAIVTEPFANS